MINSVIRSAEMRRLFAVMLVWPAIVIGGATGVAADDGAAEQPIGDLWQGQAPPPSWSGEQAAAALAMRSERHKAFIENGVPAEYQDASNPFAASGELVAEGRALYTVNCIACHGFKGFGDGDAMMDLRPTRMFLAYMIESPDLVDEYLIWTISKGGAEFGSSMPPYKDRLTEHDIWKIVAYMRAGFPGSDVP